jgi:hypothetical protein
MLLEARLAHVFLWLMVQNTRARAGAEAHIHHPRGIPCASREEENKKKKS